MEATKHFYIYPIYFDSEESCSNGRRVPRYAAHKSPRVEDLLAAVQCCGYASELEKNKSHPKSSMSLTGRIKVIFNEKLSKNQLLLNIASKIKVTAVATNTSVVPNKERTSEVVVEVTPNLIMKPRSKKKTRNNK